MIIYLVIVIIIILILFGLWYFFKNKNNSEVLNSYLRQSQMPLQISSQIPSQMNYPGNIDSAVMEINNDILQNPNNQSINLTNGHPELTAWENNISNAVARKGINASNLTNISAPMDKSANAPVYGPMNNPAYNQMIPYQESNDNSIDYDEKNTYQLLKRNDPIRPIVGEINRKSFVDPYIREELETTSKKEWWGNGEY
jgi:hypothetical protein